MKRYCIFAFCIGISYAALSLSPGDIDPIFGTHHGYTTTDIGGAVAGALGVTLQRDGKIVTAGVAGSLSLSKFAVVRYTHGGLLDTSFGPDQTGIVTKTIGPGATSDYATDVRVRSGKIIASGFTALGDYVRFALLQLNSDGSVDTSFGENGVVRTVIGADDWAIPTAMQLQSDGKIVVVGLWSVGYDYSFVVVRYNVDGSLDTTFGADHTGIVALPIIANHSSWAGDVAIQSDGKIVIGGYYQVATTDDAFQLVRLKANGRLDTTFGDNGIVRTTGVSAMMLDFINVCGVSLQSDGKIIFVGNSRKSGNFQLAVARYNASDGSLDTTFGPSKTGIVYTSVGLQAMGLGVLIQSDGKIVASGASWVGIGMRKSGLLHARDLLNQAHYRTTVLDITGVLVRYNNDGSLDTTFGDNGYITKSIDSTTNNMTLFGRLAWNPEGKIIVSGGTGHYQPSLLRNGYRVHKRVYRSEPLTFISVIAQYIGWSTSVPSDEVTAAKQDVGCMGLLPSVVDDTAFFYAALRNKYYDCKQPRACGIRC